MPEQEERLPDTKVLPLKEDQLEEVLLTIDRNADLDLLITGHGICELGLCTKKCGECKVIYCG